MLHGPSSPGTVAPSRQRPLLALVELRQGRLIDPSMYCCPSALAHTHTDAMSGGQLCQGSHTRLDRLTIRNTYTRTARGSVASGRAQSSRRSPTTSSTTPRSPRRRRPRPCCAPAPTPWAAPRSRPGRCSCVSSRWTPTARLHETQRSRSARRHTHKVHAKGGWKGVRWWAYTPYRRRP